MFSSRQEPHDVATRTACSKLSNNAALVVRELAREPAQGLLHVVAHVQQSIPVLLDTHHQLQAAAEQLQALLTELQDAQEGILSITSPATRQDLAGLAHSIGSMQDALGRLQQAQAGPDAGAVAPGGSSATGSGTAGSSRALRMLWGAPAGGAEAPS